MLFRELNLPLKTAWKRHVVCVHHCDVLALSETTSRIARFNKAERENLVEFDPVVFGRIFGDESFRPVRRAEVRDDELEGGKGLAENALNRLGEETLDVASHHNNRY